MSHQPEEKAEAADGERCECGRGQEVGEAGGAIVGREDDRREPYERHQCAARVLAQTTHYITAEK